MINALLMFGGMALVATMIVAYDFIAAHVNRRNAQKH
jgi:hypothetical protein